MYYIRLIKLFSTYSTQVSRGGRLKQFHPVCNLSRRQTEAQSVQWSIHQFPPYQFI